MKRILTLFITGLSLLCACAQQADKDVQTVREYLHSVKGITAPDELIVKAALALLHTPYVAQTLEGNQEEQLVVNLQELDCMTLVETCLALSRAAQCPHPDDDAFRSQLKTIRYRAGILNGYTSRLHYTTDWITDNVALGIIEDMTRALGGKPFRTQVGFMSSHPERYPALKDHPQDTEMMKGIEQIINQRTDYFYIPKDEIRDKQALIKSGDIIGFTTRLSGLDIAHVAIAYHHENRLSFIHASTKYMKVVINPESLVDYCEAIKTHTGIVVLRPRTVSP